MKSISRKAPFIAAAALVSLGLAVPVNAAPFPPLTTPATTEHRPGKLVWADLFTSNPEAATKFYCGLLGWTSSAIDQKGRSYVVFSNDGELVAGLVARKSAKGDQPSRWIGYVSVADMTAALAAAKNNGGSVRAPAKDFPDRGRQAIVWDDEKNPIGLLESSSGDPVDDTIVPGEWNWFELYSRNPDATSAFYHKALGYDVAPETNSGRKSEFVLSSGGNKRGGIASIPEEGDYRPSWLGVILVADMDKTLEKASALGGKVLVEPRGAEFGSRFAILLDPTGGTFGLVQYVETANPEKTP
jgi:predicted enzyme related to lactoylglutathione lyase